MLGVSAWLWRALGGDDAVGERTLRGRGCMLCNGSGYSGRIGVYEMLEMNSELAQAATHADPVAFSRLGQEQLRGRTMAHHALALVRAGTTSLAEAMRLGADSD